VELVPDAVAGAARAGPGRVAALDHEIQDGQKVLNNLS